MLDLLKTRRSIRKYQGKKVEKDKIEAILKAALMSPSSNGRKSWEFIVVEDKETLGKLSTCRERGSQLLAEAPLAIVVAVDGDPNGVWIEDVSIAAIIMQLTAHSFGLGTCWVQVRGRQYNESTTSEDYVKQILGIPENGKVGCIIAIGYPGEEKAPHDENSLPYNKIHKEKY